MKSKAIRMFCVFCMHLPRQWGFICGWMVIKTKYLHVSWSYCEDVEGEAVSVCPPCSDRPLSVYQSRSFDHKGVRYAAEIRGHVESWEFIYKVTDSIVEEKPFYFPCVPSKPVLLFCGTTDFVWVAEHGTNVFAVLWLFNYHLWSGCHLFWQINWMGGWLDGQTPLKKNLNLKLSPL